MHSNEFEVNKYITLRLENDKTQIYVNNERFDQCKSLLFNLSDHQIDKFDHIDSIDEIEHKYVRIYSEVCEQDNFTPQQEFMGHCSNLQTWYENDYNTRILHKNLAFPLLKKLTEADDKLAKKVFKKEIVSRILSNYNPVITFLSIQNYFQCFSKEELQTLILDDRINEECKIFLKKELWKKDPEAFLLENMEIIIEYIDFIPYSALSKIRGRLNLKLLLSRLEKMNGGTVQDLVHQLVSLWEEDTIPHSSVSNQCDYFKDLILSNYEKYKNIKKLITTKFSDQFLILDCHFSEAYNETPIFIMRTKEGFKDKIMKYKRSFDLLKDQYADYPIYKIDIFDSAPTVIDIDIAILEKL